MTSENPDPFFQKLSTANRTRLFPFVSLLPAGLGGFFLCISLSLLFANWLYPAGFFLGSSSFWLQQNADVSQYIAGFNAFVHEPWQWPLLHIASINWPQGTLATFVDSIPLYAFVLKLFYQGADVPFWNPYGGWVALCYIMQGVGAWWICREANIRSWSALAALTLLFATFPVFTFRIHHLSLMSQWLLVFGFACYLRSTRRSELAWKAWAMLLFAAFYVNIYLFSMLSALFAADLIRCARHDGWRKTLQALAAVTLPLALSLFITMLPLADGAGATDTGFGIYSMNLLSPLAGGRLIDWNHALAQPGQGEGFNYVGLFMFAMFGIAVTLRTRKDCAFWRRHALLAGVLLLANLYALSNQVYVDHYHLLDLKMPEWSRAITGQLRASGRFFWPVGYAMVIFTVLTLCRHLARPNVPVVLSMLVILQFWDLAPMHAERSATVRQTAPVLIHQEEWNNFFGKEITTLYFFPAFHCGKSPSDTTLLPTMLYAVKRNLNLSTGYVARIAQPCAAYDRQMSAVQGQAAGFVLAREDYASVDDAVAFLGGQDSVVCTTTDFAHLCKRKSPT